MFYEPQNQAKKQHTAHTQRKQKKRAWSAKEPTAM
jgi:hypothetical protein